MSKHTEGEWAMHYVSEICIGVVAKTDVEGYVQAVCNTILPDTDEQYEKEREEIEANARLMAASPELLEFAKAFSEILANGEMDIHAKEGFNKRVADMVRLNIKAIKKATT